MDTTFGASAAILSCLLWSWSIIKFQPALEQLGASACNYLKAMIASIIFVMATIILVLVFDVEFPPLDDALLLVVSGIAGMALGDLAFFGAIKRLGAREAALLHATAPIFLLAFALCVDPAGLKILEYIGVIAVVIGVLDVTSQQKDSNPEKRGQHRLGVVFGLGAALGQAVGILISAAPAARSHFIPASMLRIVGAMMAMAVIFALRGRAKDLVRVTIQAQSWKLALLPSVVGTFLGIATMTVAIQMLKPAVSGALLALTPVFLVPMAFILLGQRVGMRALFGTVMAVGGVIAIEFAGQS